MSFLVSEDHDVVYMQCTRGTLEELQNPRVPPDDERFSRTVMVHKTCNGYVDVLPTSEIAQVMLCRKCSLRVVVPSSVATFGDFRNWLSVRAAHPGGGPQ